MPVPDEELVRAVLAKNDRDIRCRETIESAWTSVKEEYPHRAWFRRKSTTRALVWEHSVQNAIAEFEGSEGVRIIPHNDTFSFIFDDKVLLRLKKASMQLISSNYPTLSALLFHRHDADLFGFDGHHRVELVHVFNRFETGLDWIGIVARQAKKVIWDFELRTGGAEIEAFPVPKQRPPAADSVLRPFKNDADEASDKKED